MKSVILGILVLTLSFSSNAMNTGGYYKIKSLWTWGGYANGAVLIVLENQPSLCPGGFWFQDSPNSGSKNLLSMALAAFHSKSPVMIYADESSDFSGLSTKECEIQLITI